LRPAGDKKPRLFLMRDALVSRDEALAESKKPTCTEEEMDGYVYPKGQDGKAAEGRAGQGKRPRLRRDALPRGVPRRPRRLHRHRHQRPADHRLISMRAWGTGTSLNSTPRGTKIGTPPRCHASSIWRTSSTKDRRPHRLQYFPTRSQPHRQHAKASLIPAL
jgi:hypothetical protein